MAPLGGSGRGTVVAAIADCVLAGAANRMLRVYDLDWGVAGELIGIAFEVKSGKLRLSDIVVCIVCRYSIG